MSTKIDALMSSDERLWRAVIAGDTAAFHSVVDRYQSAVSAIAFSVLGDFNASQDVAQETFWGAWKSREQLREPQRLGGWLCGIARNMAHDWRRCNRKLESNRSDSYGEPISPLADPVEQSIRAEEESIVWTSLQELPESYREVLALYYRQGKTAAEVALILELSEDAVKQRLSRGRSLLREQVATLIEGVLVRGRPGKNFTAKVMAGIVGLAASAQTGGTALAATTVGKIAGGAASSVAAVATKSLLASGAAGLAGGLLGAAGGLGGAYLGTWLPAEFAATGSERKLLQQFGRRQFRIAIFFTLAILAATPLLFLTRGWMYYLGIVAGSAIAYVVYVTTQCVRIQRLVGELRAHISPADDPNPSPLKQRLEAARAGGTACWKGRSYTSSWSFLSLPLVDVQVSDRGFAADVANQGAKIARGWIAIGDRAHGVVLGIGGFACGFFAIGGITIGAVCIGGVAIGLASFGGMAIGFLSLGGLAIGHTAVGGGALGWDAAGGAAIGWHSAAGGLAIANHAATGGLAVARDFAVGGQAMGAQVNTPAAQQAMENESLKWILDWLVANQLWFIAATMVISFAPMLLSFCFYRRQIRPKDDKSIA